MQDSEQSLTESIAAICKASVNLNHSISTQLIMLHEGFGELSSPLSMA